MNGAAAAPHRHTPQVRQAVFADLDALAALLDQHRVLQRQPSDVLAARAFLKARFDHGESVLFIAEADTGQGLAGVGFAQLYPSYSSTALARVLVLNDLFVQEQARRQGVAARLLHAVEQYAWAHGAVRLTLNVARDNTVGQALYTAQGWQADQQFHMFHRFPPAL